MNDVAPPFKEFNKASRWNDLRHGRRPVAPSPSLARSRLAHLVSTNRELCSSTDAPSAFLPHRLQFKPLKDPRTGVRRDAWHWDLGGPVLPPPTPTILEHRQSRRPR